MVHGLVGAVEQDQFSYLLDADGGSQLSNLQTGDLLVGFVEDLLLVIRAFVVERDLCFSHHCGK